MMGLPFGVINDLMIGEQEWYGGALHLCFVQPEPPVAELIQSLEKVQALNTKLFKLYERYAGDTRFPSDLADLRPIDIRGELGLDHDWLSWGTLQRQTLTNSSTNMDRKRAAYVLKRFFCDDLTPVGIEEDPNHGGGAHGTEPSCRACHYKLDPMAGFFRSYGRDFRDFSSSMNITFDDGAKADLQQYMTAWRGVNREWDVGYVRSVKDESLNDYGSTLGDLHALLRRAPEVKACLVRRVFEYAVGDSQTIDPGFLEHVSKEFVARAARDSSAAFRWVMSQAALSNTFRQRDPVPGECYDQKPGADPAGAPPCRVAYLLEKNCKDCHKSAADHGGLSLVEWKPGPDGRLTFPHIGDDGKPLGLQATLEQIVYRLTTTDPDERMPSKGRFMSAQDREALYKWAEDSLGSLKRSRP
jgi:hypothetical protein